MRWKTRERRRAEVQVMKYSPSFEPHGKALFSPISLRFELRGFFLMGFAQGRADFFSRILIQGLPRGLICTMFPPLI